jgi:single-stranded-DNA-specific exonuclease
MLFANRPAAPTVASQLLTQGCPSILAPLLAARGVQQFAELKPSLAQLLPPDGLKNAALAATLLADAIQNNESICVVADYDCDGATACAVAVLGLGMLGAAQVGFLVPNRFKTGYGLTPEVVEQVAAHPRLSGKNGKPDWIVTVDNGIASVDGIALANTLGIRTLVTDHHLAGDVLPDAAAILNPNQPGCGFASKSIAGVGVMFYALLLTRAELRKRGVFTLTTQPKLDNLLDLVAIGTVADVVKLDANNRALVGAGLERIRKGAINGTLRAGVAALFAVAGRDAARATTADIGFTVGPRINAAGRLDDMSIGIACLLTDDPAQAQRLASELQAMNLARRELEGDMQTSALVQADAAFAAMQGQNNASGLVLYDPSWHQGVVGLVASRIKDAYWRPTLAFAPADDTGENSANLRGSARSIAGFHIRDALDIVAKRHPALIQKFGGHAMAAGLSIATADLPAFKAAFEAVCTELLGAQSLERVLLTDTAPRTVDMTVDNVALLDAQVWGQGFEAPVFESPAIVLEQRLLKDAHLKLKLDIGGNVLDAIWFGHTDTLPTRVTVAYRLSINEFRGNRSVQAMVEWAQ